MSLGPSRRAVQLSGLQLPPPTSLFGVWGSSRQLKEVVRVVVVYGTRPEVIKLTPVIRELRSRDSFAVTVVDIGQHKEMTAKLQEHFQLRPDVHLDVMRPGQSLNELSSRVYPALVGVLDETKPHVVVVQGDTTSAMLGALVAFNAKIHVVHVESGLRTGSLQSPYPEELNRRVIAQVCTLCFAPTSLSASYLGFEGVHPSRVFTVGNSVIDQLHWSSKNPPADAKHGVVLTKMQWPSTDSSTGKETTAVRGSSIGASNAGPERTQPTVEPLTYTLRDLKDTVLEGGKHVILLTAHRRENLGGPMERMCDAVRAAVETRQANVTVIFPVHANPAVREVVAKRLGDLNNVWMVEPVDYPYFVQVLRRVTVVVTDSGGIQEEAVSLGLPTLVTRTTTERPEGVHAGVTRLVGTDTAGIRDALIQLLSDRSAYAAMSSAASPFGSGDTSLRIAHIMQLHSETLMAPPAVQQDFVSPPQPGLLDNTAANEIAHGKGRRKVKGAITIVMTVYKRSVDVFRQQLESLLRQTMAPAEIFVWQNEAHSDIQGVLADYPDVKHVWARTWNSKFHGRFLLPLMIDTEFVAVVDDDMIPGDGWLAHAVGLVRQHNCVVGSSGRDIVLPEALSPTATYWHAQEVTRGPESEPRKADFVGHWWVMRSQWAHHIWAVPHPTFFTSEDTSISAALQLYGGIDSMVAGLNVPDRINPEIKNDETIGGDAARKVASSSDPSHGEVRMSVFRYWMARGWTPKAARASNGPIGGKRRHE